MKNQWVIIGLSVLVLLLLLYILFGGCTQRVIVTKKFKEGFDDLNEGYSGKYNFLEGYDTEGYDAEGYDRVAAPVYPGPNY